ncbi:hypothetical protein AHAS_Ahas04G0108300 [Arachis hypogaea]
MNHQFKKLLMKRTLRHITQPPRLGFKDLKAINKSIEKRIVTKLQRTIFMKKRRSTTSNPPPDPASKLNQAINKRKLAKERPRQGAIPESSPFLRKSFNLLEEKIHHHGQRKDIKSNNDDDTEKTNGL